MNREEFMKKLEELLQNIPAEEREEAVHYYQDYFDDAGPEHEAEVIQELESPEKVADLIKADIEEFSEENGEYTENGYQDSRFDDRNMPAKRGYRYQQQTRWSERNRTEGAEKNTASYQYQETVDMEKGAETANNGTQPRTSLLLKVILIIAIILVAVPVVLPIGLGVFGTVVGIVCAALGLLLGVLIGAVAVFFSGIVAVGVGIVKIAVSMPVGIFTIGCGLVLMAVGLAATVGLAKLCMIVYPALFRGIVNLCRKPFHRKEEASE